MGLECQENHLEVLRENTISHRLETSCTRLAVSQHHCWGWEEKAVAATGGTGRPAVLTTGAEPQT